MHDKHVCVNKFKSPAAPQRISPRHEGLPATPNYSSSVDELLDPLLNDFPSIEGFPDLVWRLVDNVPIMQVICELRKISLLALPLAVRSDFDGRADHHHRNSAVLDGAG